MWSGLDNSRRFESFPAVRDFNRAAKWLIATVVAAAPTRYSLGALHEEALG
jgi:hypothetical protein